MQQLSIAHACEHAERDGVRAGMPLSLARALCPQAQVQSWEARSDVRSLYRIALRAEDLSPFCSFDAEIFEAHKSGALEKLHPLFWGLILDISGMQRVHQNEPALIEHIKERFERVGIICRCAIAPTIGSAWALSRFAPIQRAIIAPSEPIRSALAELPLAALRLPEQVLSGLYLVGLKLVRDVLKFPAKELAARFGVEALRKVDQALGFVEERPYPLPRTDTFKAQRHFEIPITTHALLSLATLQLFEQLFKSLLMRKRRAGIFSICLHGKHSDGSLFRHKKDLLLTCATKNFRHLQSIIAPILEKCPLPGGIAQIQVQAHRLERSNEEQCNFLEPHDIQQILTQSNEFLNCLANTLGQQSIRQLCCKESFIPENSFTYAPIQREKASTPSTPTFIINRPPLLLARPEQITALAMLPDKAPARIVWKGEELKILCAIGPERISAEWWQQMPEAPFQEREYFRLQDQRGRWLWVFRERQSLFWFIHGLW